MSPIVDTEQSTLLRASDVSARHMKPFDILEPEDSSIGPSLTFGNCTSILVTIPILGLLVTLHQRNHAKLYERVT
jgi:hypothetical protein